ncbi:type II toxin-antitoxin system HicB family antitoxin [Xanthobacter autotrophicus]|uniref:type II toxin-antitoxin system HicB family antitoxin n=1 Tax=Xanthobacter autotrophicus TaxID=280 RepID=UPI00372B3EE4
MSAPVPTDLEAYPVTVAPIPPEEGGGFVASFPDVPGCHGVGETEEEALADGRQALFACIDALKAADREPPAPGSAKG